MTDCLVSFFISRVSFLQATGRHRPAAAVQGSHIPGHYMHSAKTKPQGRGVPEGRQRCLYVTASGSRKKATFRTRTLRLHDTEQCFHDGFHGCPHDKPLVRWTSPFPAEEAAD